jgi:NADPH-dependent 2,4-dienoyl-CoA reductase/sulfur reductase-like enzyme
MQMPITENPACLDVAIVGGGPAGISAGLELSKRRSVRVALFERDAHLGGMPRSCHYFFGMRDQKRVYTGPVYARKLARKICSTNVQIHTDAMVLDISPGNFETPHRLNVLSPEGLVSYQSRFIVLATGCCERSRHSRMIPGSRPAGIYTTGTLQQLVNLNRMRFTGKRAVIIGTELVAFSSVLTLRHAGVSIAAMVEQCADIHSYGFLAAATKRFYNFPIYRDTAVEDILGNEKVEGVQLLDNRTQQRVEVPCDMVIITGRFRPESSLIDHTRIERDAATDGPTVDMNLLTSVPNIYAAGNVLRGADMHDLCALEGRQAARHIMKQPAAYAHCRNEWVSLRTEPPIRYVVPQKVSSRKIPHGYARWFFPGPAFQMSQTIRNAVMEAVSGTDRIWEGSYRKLIAHTRYPLSLEKFDWSRVNQERGIVLRLRSFS